MNVVFLTMARIVDIKSAGIYTDLLRKFRDDGHVVYIVTPFERKFKKRSAMEFCDGVYILGVKTLNLQKTNAIEKGIGQLLLEYQYENAIKRYLSNVTFDLILYSTPPITFNRVIEKLKTKNEKAISYLLLKDIFPQNAVDLGMISNKSLIYRLFRSKEKKLYEISDYIGCMSRANVDYVLNHNSFIDHSKVEINPNSLSISFTNKVKNIDKEFIRKKYKLPIDKPIIIYGGNLGKPQGIDFLIDILNANKNRNDCFFLIVGSGTEYNKLFNWCVQNNPGNTQLFNSLPKKDYESLAASCDIGLILLDKRFTIPNYPSRLLSYLSNKMPILVASDINTDVGLDAENNGYGYFSESGDIISFNENLDKLLFSADKRRDMGICGYKYMCENFSIDRSYSVILKHFQNV